MELRLRLKTGRLHDKGILVFNVVDPFTHMLLATLYSSLPCRGACLATSASVSLLRNLSHHWPCTCTPPLRTQNPCAMQYFSLARTRPARTGPDDRRVPAHLAPLALQPQPPRHTHVLLTHVWLNWNFRRVNSRVRLWSSRFLSSQRRPNSRRVGGGSAGEVHDIAWTVSIQPMHSSLLVPFALSSETLDVAAE